MQWTETVGVRLAERDLTSMQLQLANGQAKSFQILHLFPFTSETKRMGIIVKVRMAILSRYGILLYERLVFCR